MKFYIHRNSGNKVFVKEKRFAESQGILMDNWGKKWTLIEAESIEHARQIGDDILPESSFKSYPFPFRH